MNHSFTLRRTVCYRPAVMADEPVHLVAVIGAGPAGLFATRALAAAGRRVVLLNRDIKPGGLAEYGIFLNKYKMKGGLRRQFQKILTDPRVTYLGHVTVATDGDLTVARPGRAWASTRWSSPSAPRAPSTSASRASGCRASTTPRTSSITTTACRPSASGPSPWAAAWPSSGVGNVMVDIANYCAHFCDCDEIIAIARRGPFEKAYDDREFEDVEDAFDHALYREEIERVRPRLEAAGQNPDDLLDRARRQARARRRERAPGCASASSPRPGAWSPRAAAWSGSRWRRRGSSARATASPRSAPASSRR